MAYNYKNKTAEERKLEIDSLTDEMHVNLRNYATDPKELEAFLVFMSQFYDYSLKNQLLIHSQFKGAFGVASFKTFKDWGLSVLKGEKENLAAHKTTVETRKRVSFKLGTVFDVTQTNAQPEDYPDLFPNRKKDFQYTRKQMVILKKTLLRYANEEQIGVQTAKISNSPAKRYYRPDTHTIVLSNRNNKSESIHTLIHELAHAFGLDTKTNSLHYTAQWTQNLEHVTELETALEEVKHVSHTLISRLETLLEHEQLNVQVNLKDASKLKNSALAQAFFSIHTIEPITQIGRHRVYDLKLHSKTTGPQKYRILTTKKPNEIAHTWVGEKSGTDWLKEHALTAFVEKHPEITSPQEKIATLEKTIAGEAQPFNHFMKETRERTSQKELRY
ncbi:ArdC-like ssDNA-binding domain-containing protein [Aerococcus viridans]